MPLTTEDRLEIQDLMARFAFTTDTKGPDAMREIFVDDGQFIIAAMQLDLKGLDNIVSWIKESAGSFPEKLNHVLSNFIIDGDGAEAHVCCISQAMKIEDGVITPFGIGYYDETVVKTADGWRLKVHKLDLRG